MRSLTALAAGMCAVAVVAVACGSSSDSAMPGARAGPIGNSSTSSSTLSSASAPPAGSSSTSSSSGASSSSSATAPSSSSSSSTSSNSGSSASSSSSSGAPVYAIVDLGIPSAADALSWSAFECEGDQISVLGPPLPTPFYDCAYYEPTPDEALTIYAGYAALGAAGAWHAAKLEILGGANNGLTDLGPAPGGTSSQAFSLNTQGLIVGVGDSNDTRQIDGLCCAEHALIWGTAASSVAVLPSLGAGDAGVQASALSINDFGEVVGWSEVQLADGTFVHRAAVWLPSAANTCPSMVGYCSYELDRFLAPGSPSVVLTEADAINCAGDIAARATSSGPTPPEVVEHDYLLVRQGTPRNCAGPSPPLKRQLRGVSRLRRG